MYNYYLINSTDDYLRYQLTCIHSSSHIPPVTFLINHSMSCHRENKQALKMNLMRISCSNDDFQIILIFEMFPNFYQKWRFTTSLMARNRVTMILYFLTIYNGQIVTYRAPNLLVKYLLVYLENLGHQAYVLFLE